MKTNDMALSRSLTKTTLKATPRPGRQNPVPSTPDPEPDEPQRSPGPNRKKKGTYEIVMQSWLIL